MSKPQTPTSYGIVEYKQWVHRSCYLSIGTDSGLHSVKQRRKYWEETSWFGVVGVFVCGSSLAPTWCWCCGWAHTGHCCCWCWDWDWGCGGSCWAWALMSGCLCRWGNRAEVRCLRTPGCRLAGRRTAWSGHEHPDSSRPHRTVGENEGYERQIINIYLQKRFYKQYEHGI